jgi:RsiW-degrading membrane proteinase PrsW (M82 family)
MADAKPPRKDWRTYLSVVLTALGIVIFLMQAFSMSIVWLTRLIGGQNGSMSNIPGSLSTWSFLLMGALLLPVFLMSLNQLRGKDDPLWLQTDRPALRKNVFWVMVLWPAVVALGWLVAGNQNVAMFLLGPINLLAAGLPVLWILNAASWKLNGGPRLRQWRIFGFSLTVMPFLVILVELIAILILTLFGGLYITYRMSVDPILKNELTLLYEQIAASVQDIDQILILFESYFRQPSVIFWAAAIMGGVMPIIEEVVKPIALFPLARKGITPQEGFIGGLLCGAGFALTENLLYFNIALNAEDWLFMAIGRAGTGILHMLASGLVGWGLVKTWRSGKWGAQALLSFSAFLLHGLWNALALFVGFAPDQLLETEPDFWVTMLFNIPILLLLLLSIAGMVLINRHFRKKLEDEPGDPGESIQRKTPHLSLSQSSVNEE